MSSRDILGRKQYEERWTNQLHNLHACASQWQSWNLSINIISKCKSLITPRNGSNLKKYCVTEFRRDMRTLPNFKVTDTLNHLLPNADLHSARSPWPIRPFWTIRISHRNPAMNQRARALSAELLPQIFVSTCQLHAKHRILAFCQRFHCRLTLRVYHF